MRITLYACNGCLTPVEMRDMLFLKELCASYEKQPVKNGQKWFAKGCYRTRSDTKRESETMGAIRRPTGQIFFFVLSLIGVGISIYLTLVHYNTNVPLACSTSGFINCENVLASPYALVPGTSIPISIPGLLWFLVAGGLALLAWRTPEARNILLAEITWSALGVLTALYLVYVELVRLHTLCAWCTGLHVLMLTLLIIAIFQLQQARIGEEWEEEEGSEDTLPSLTSERR